MQSYTSFEDKLRQNDSVNVPALASAYVQTFKSQLLPSSQSLAESSDEGKSNGGDPNQRRPAPTAAAAAAAGGSAVKQQPVSLKTFKDLTDDLRLQLKDINELSDKVGCYAFTLSSIFCICCSQSCYFAQLVAYDMTIKMLQHVPDCTSIPLKRRANKFALSASSTALNTSTSSATSVRIYTLHAEPVPTCSSHQCKLVFSCLASCQGAARQPSSL